MSTQNLEGQQLEIAVLSPPIGGLLRTWTSGGSRLWRVERSDELRQLLGQGVVARTGMEKDRFREVGFVGPTGALLVHARMKHGQEQGPAQVFQLEPAAPPEVNDECWSQLAQWFRGAVLAAAARGEFLVLERGGWDLAPTPFGFWGCFRQAGVWTSVVEAEPWPGKIGPWAGATRADRSATLAAPASPQTLPAAAVLTVMSVSGWADSPWDLALTCGRSPSGPVPAEIVGPAESDARVNLEVPAPPAPDTTLDAQVLETVDALNPADAVRRFVRDLEGKRPLTATVAAQYVKLRPAAGGRVAVYVHRRRVSLGLEPTAASAAERALPGIKVEPRNATTWYVVVPDEVLASARAQVLSLAIEAVDRAVQL